jgi:hypothetical protein
MRSQLLIGSALAVVLSINAGIFAGAVKTAPPGTVDQPCCTLDDCCLECILCCSLDGCCEECIQCCIELGCDPSCCFPALTRASTQAPKKAEACCAGAKGCCAKTAKKTKSCGEGCCN